MHFRLKSLPWLLLGVVLIGLVIVGLSLGRITFDLTWLFIALAAMVVSWVVYRATQHVFAPARAYLIETSVNITDPLIPFIGRHTFHAEIVVRDTKKGLEDVVTRKTIKLAFRGTNASKFRQECMALLSQTLSELQSTVKKMDPEAQIIVQETPEQLINSLPMIEV